MKKLLSLALVLCFWTWPLSAQVVVVKHKAASADPAIVQPCSNSAFGATVDCVFSSNVTLNNVVWFWGTYIGAASTPSVAVKAGSTCAISFSNVDVDTTIGNGAFIGAITTGGACTVTLTETGGSANIAIMGGELSHAQAVLDGHSYHVYSVGSPQTAWNSNSISPAVDKSMVIAGGRVSSTIGVNSPFTIGPVVASPNSADASYLQPSHGAITATFTSASAYSAEIEIFAIKKQ